MSHQKRSELVAGIAINNIIAFSNRDSENTKAIKKVLKLKQCGVTKSCLTNESENVYKCTCFDKCNKLESILKLFL